MFLLVVGSVAIRFVHANANLFLSQKIDQFRMLSRLYLDFAVILAMGDTLYFVFSSVVDIFNCLQSARLFEKELFDPNEAGCVSASNVGDLLDGTPPHQHCSLKALDLGSFLLQECRVLGHLFLND